MYCKECYKPHDLDSCDNCGSDEKVKFNRDFSVKQWEWFYKLTTTPGTAHDFMPYEFSEDGEITRGNGTSGVTGYTGPNQKRDRKTPWRFWM